MEKKDPCADGHAPVANQCIVINRNHGAGQCAACGRSIKLRDGKWIVG